MQPARILIADVVSALPILKCALAGYELVTVTRMAEAERLIVENGIDIFVIGLQFDDSRVGELVKIIRLDVGHQDTPVIVVKLLSSAHADLVRRSMEVMKRVRTINEYLDLECDLDTVAKVRAAIEKYLPADKLIVAPKPVSE